MEKIHDGRIVKSSHTSLLYQIWYSFISSSPLILCGCVFGFSAIALPYMVQPNDVLYINSDQASWIASLVSLVTPLGCLLSSYLVDRIGRRSTLIYGNVFSIIGWLFIAIEPDVSRVYFGRILQGLSLGIVGPVPCIYVVELASPKYRGFLLNFGSMALAVGILFVYGLSLILQDDWKMIAAICCALGAIFSFMTFLIPESALWLRSKGRIEESIQALIKFRRNERKIIEREVADTFGANEVNKNLTLWNGIKAFRKPEAYKPLIVMSIFFIFQQLSGSFVILFYAVDLIKEAGVTLDPFVAAFALAVMRLIFINVSGLISNRYGRRAASIPPSIVMAISLCVVAVYRQIIDSQGSTDIGLISKILPITCLLIYISMCTIGLLSIPWAMCTEVFSTETRGIAGGFTIFVAYVSSGVILKLYPFMVEVLGEHGVFYFFTISSLLAVVFLYFYLPETQGWTVPEIEEFYRKGIPAWKTKVKREEIRNGALKPEGVNLLEPSKIIPMKDLKTSGV